MTSGSPCQRGRWHSVGWGGLKLLALAYALTVHKAQGSQYEYILFPVVRHFSLYRNLLYTAVSRAQKQVVLFGSKDALNTAIQAVPKPRHSMLVAKTRLALQHPQPKKGERT